METNTKTLSQEAMKVIDGYRYFKIGNAVASVPYFNNKTIRRRASIRALIGKGNPRDILDEMHGFVIKHRIATDTLSDEVLEMILTDNNIGVDCSAFFYHVMEAENISRGHGNLNRRLSFVHNLNPLSKFRAYLRPVENCDVGTIASERNSRVIGTNEASPGDFISMIDLDNKNEHNHILLIHAVDYDSGKAKKIYYSHAIRYDSDKLYESGIRNGKINITNKENDIVSDEWSEDGKTGPNSPLWIRAKNSRTELRRLKWL